MVRPPPWSPLRPIRTAVAAAAAEEGEPEESPALHQFDEFDWFLLDFDPVNEWLLDPDQLPMAGDEAKMSCPKAEPDIFSTKLPAKDEILCPSIDEKMKNVSLVESSDGNAHVIPASDLVVVSNGNDGADSNGVVSNDCILHGSSVGGGKARDGADDFRQVMNAGDSKDCIFQGSSVGGGKARNGADEFRQVMNAGDCKDCILQGSSVGGGKARNGADDFRQVMNASDSKTDCNEVREVRSMKETERESSGTVSEESEDEEEDDDDAESGDSSSSTSTSGISEKNEDDIGGDNSEKDEEDGEVGKNSSFRKLAMADENEDIEGDEIRNADIDGMLIGSDEDGEVPKGPIRSKHEIEVLPPVPKVEVSLEPHHQMLPVGVVSSILDNRVIVEGLEKHNPLNDGSILWMTERRAPLGFVDELFGPVKNPYYVVRYNSDKEIPDGINVGTAVSFVREFASYVLNQKDLYKKGYDASGENDEELNDEVEFTDDEKEAEYRRSLRQAKRRNSEKWQGNQETAVDRRCNYKGAGSRKTMPPSNRCMPEVKDRAFPCGTGPIQPPVAAGNAGCSNYGSFGVGDASLSAAAMVPTLMLAAQMSSCFGDLSQQQPNAFWLNGFPPQQLQQQQHLGIQGLLMSMLPRQQLGDQTYTQQMQSQLFNSFQNGIPFQQQLVPGLQASANAQWLGGQMSPFVASMPNGPSLAGNFGSETFGCKNVQEQGPSEFCNDQNVQPASTLLERPRPPEQFNRGRSSLRGRRPYHRGGRHSLGRGGRAHNN